MNKEPQPGNYIAEALVTRWIQHERRYREQVAAARMAGTPCAGMMAHADQLSECRRELQTAYGLRKEADDNTPNPQTKTAPVVALPVAGQAMAAGPAPLEGMMPDEYLGSLSLHELCDAYRLAKADPSDRGMQCAGHFRRELMRRHAALVAQSVVPKDGCGTLESHQAQR